MKRNLVEIYALAICFLAVVCFIVAAGLGIYDVIQIVKPGFTISSYEYKKYQSNKKFIKGCEDKYADYSEEEITEMRLEGWENALKIEQRKAFQSITMVFIILLIDTVAFVFHWLLAKKIRLQENTSV